MTTIVIDDEAYNRLMTARRNEESLSQTIKRIVPPPFDFDAWIRQLEADPVSDEFVKAVEEQVSARRQPTTRER